MEHMNSKARCLHLRVMWLVFMATIVVSVSFPTLQQPGSSLQSTNYTTVDNITTPTSVLEAKSTRDDSTNVTLSTIDDVTTLETNTTYQNTDSFSPIDELLELTSSLGNQVCAPCAALGFNSTETTDLKGNSSSYISSTVASPEVSSAFNIGIIIGIVVLVIIIIILIGVIGFFAYRRYYPTLCSNRPQTLTDKFSNDESTGYIDDSAFRENSEEMYSLDNDSFLNSLEAMTIQNYWTDHVRHTKL